MVAARAQRAERHTHIERERRRLREREREERERDNTVTSIDESRRVWCCILWAGTANRIKDLLELVVVVVVVVVLEAIGLLLIYSNGFVACKSFPHSQRSCFVVITFSSFQV